MLVDKKCRTKILFTVESPCLLSCKSFNHPRYLRYNLWTPIWRSNFFSYPKKSYYKKKAPKSYHFFILKDGVSVTSDTYWQEPSYFVPSSVCVLIFYHHTVLKINNELQFSLCWNNPTRRKVFLNHYLPVKCLFISYVNALFATVIILHTEHKFASINPRQARLNSPT